MGSPHSGHTATWQHSKGRGVKVDQRSVQVDVKGTLPDLLKALLTTLQTALAHSEGYRTAWQLVQTSSTALELIVVTMEGPAQAEWDTIWQEYLSQREGRL